MISITADFSTVDTMVTITVEDSEGKHVATVDEYGEKYTRLMDAVDAIIQNEDVTE